ncbi:MAG TPA: F0F1 ATP synthase subunit delta [Gammaproteobacteria bacterium]
MADTSTVARPYAQALFDIASAGGTLAEWSGALAALAAVVADRAASAFLSRPDIGAEARAEFLTSVGKQVATGDLVDSDNGRNFIRLLIENDRLSALADISARFDTLKAEAENTVKVTLVTAVEADSAVSDRIAAGLEKRLGRKVELELKIDSELLGGAVVRAEDRVIDGSVRTRLEQLAESLIS